MDTWFRKRKVDSNEIVVWKVHTMHVVAALNFAKLGIYVKRGRKYKRKLELTVTKNGRCRESFIGAAWIRWLFFLFHIFFLQSVVHQHKMPSSSQVPKRKTALSAKCLFQLACFFLQHWSHLKKQAAVYLILYFLFHNEQIIKFD